MGQLVEIERTVCGPKVPALNGTEASLSYVQCILYLLEQMSLFLIEHGRTFSGQTSYMALNLHDSITLAHN